MPPDPRCPTNERGRTVGATQERIYSYGRYLRQTGRMLSPEDNEQGGIVLMSVTETGSRPLPGRACCRLIVFDVLARRFTVCR